MSVLIASENREILREYYVFNLPSKSTVKILMDKTLFAEFAERNGFHIPQTLISNNLSDIESISGTVNYPCLIKPSFRQPIWDKSTPIKVFKALSKEELISLYQKNSSLATKFVIQELIPGPDSEVYFCLLSYNSLSKPLGSFTGRKLAQWMPELGSTCIAESSKNDMVLNESIRLFDCLKYQGIGSVEFKRDKRDNQFKIIEPTVGRADLQSAIAYYNGINIPLLEYCDCLGLETPKCISQNGRTIWVNEENLLWLLTSRKSKGSRNEWLRIIKKRKAYALFELTDIKPFICFLFSMIRTIFKKLW
jgi:predicted ATP-grasp superfamily ATP-dependent carboligase